MINSSFDKDKYKHYLNNLRWKKFISNIITCEPALNAINPKVRINPPREIKGMECPAIYLLSSSRNRSTLGPKIIAPEILVLLLRGKCMLDYKS